MRINTILAWGTHDNFGKQNLLSKTALGFGFGKNFLFFSIVHLLISIVPWPL